jgi:hypothetical protein
MNPSCNCDFKSLSGIFDYISDYGGYDTNNAPRTGRTVNTQGFTKSLYALNPTSACCHNYFYMHFLSYLEGICDIEPRTALQYLPIGWYVGCIQYEFNINIGLSLPIYNGTCLNLILMNNTPLTISMKIKNAWKRYNNNDDIRCKLFMYVDGCLKEYDYNDTIHLSLIDDALESSGF